MPELHVSVETEQGLTRATILNESLSEERLCTIVAEEVENALPDDKPACILDMTNVRFCTSTGIGCLVRLHNACGKRKGKLAIVNIDPQIAGSLKVAKLDRLFNLAKDEKAARKALG